MGALPYLTKMLTHSKYTIFTNSSLFWTPQTSGYHFRSKWAPLIVDKWKVDFLPPMGIEYNAKFSIYFVSEISRVFLCKAISKYLKSYEQNSKNNI